MKLTPRRVARGILWRANDALQQVRKRVRIWNLERRSRARARSGVPYFDHERLTRSYMTAWALLLAEDPTAARGSFLEFGVYYGSSVACMYDALGRLGLPGVRIYGFDSFEGLPASAAREAGSPWIRGQFRSSLSLTRHYLASRGVPEDGVTLIKGWFSETATD
ncbi:MAG TPA: TylF/MycF/NovP-related O-methyltransferase, partial [Gemmatimonadales bacterium]